MQPYLEGLRPRWSSLLAATAVAALAWFAAQDELTRMVRGVAERLVELSGYESSVLKPNQLGIVFGLVADDGETRKVVFGTSLERWHVNLIALPGLVFGFGRFGWCQRSVMCFVGLSVLLIVDALCAACFVALQGWGGPRSTTASALDADQRAALQSIAMTSLAVYGSKLTPIGVWAFMCVVVGRRSRWVRTISKRARVALGRTATSRGAQRNEPCRCGSGEKTKKCCH